MIFCNKWGSKTRVLDVTSLAGIEPLGCCSTPEDKLSKQPRADGSISGSYKVHRERLFALPQAHL